MCPSKTNKLCRLSSESLCRLGIHLYRLSGFGACRAPQSSGFRACRASRAQGLGSGLAGGMAPAASRAFVRGSKRGARISLPYMGLNS